MISLARPNPLYLILSGIAFAGLSILAFMAPRSVVVSPDLLLAGALVLGGVLQLWNSRQKCNPAIKVMYRWFGLGLVIGGLALATIPALNFSVMGIVIAIVCAIAGVFQFILALRIRDHRPWILMLGSSAVSIIIAIILLAQMPEPAVTLVGLLFAVSAGISALAHIIVGVDLYRHG